VQKRITPTGGRSGGVALALGGAVEDLARFLIHVAEADGAAP